MTGAVRHRQTSEASSDPGHPGHGNELGAPGVEVDRLAWLTLRQAAAGQGVRRWTKSEIDMLHAWVGKQPPSEIARRLQRTELSVKNKARTLGYSITNVLEPLGVTARGLARRLGIGYYTVLGAIYRGGLRALKEGKKDYLVRWRQAQSYERKYRQFALRRRRALERISERTISAERFARFVGVSTTQARRYLEGKIVRAWRVPLDPGHYEWRVSLRDARRIKHARAAGTLSLRRKRFRALVARSSARVNQMRRARRAAPPDDLSQPAAKIEGCYSVPQVASAVRLSEAEVYAHIALGRLEARREKIGSRERIGIEAEALGPYLEWCRRKNRPTGPLRPWRATIERLHKAGLISVGEAARRYHVNPRSLSSALRRKRICGRKIGGLWGIRPINAYRHARRLARDKRRGRHEPRARADAGRSLGQGGIAASALRANRPGGKSRIGG